MEPSMQKIYSSGRSISEIKRLNAAGRRVKVNTSINTLGRSLWQKKKKHRTNLIFLSARQRRPSSSRQLENLIIPNQWTMELLLAGTSSSVLTQRVQKILICTREMSAPEVCCRKGEAKSDSVHFSATKGPCAKKDREFARQRGGN